MRWLRVSKWDDLNLTIWYCEAIDLKHQSIPISLLDLGSFWWNFIFRDNFVILQALMASLAIYLFPHEFANLPVWQTKGIVAIVLVHVLVSEPLYYWVHRFLHGNYFFTPYHSFHHSSTVPQPVTGNGIHSPPIFPHLWSIGVVTFN